MESQTLYDYTVRIFDNHDSVGLSEQSYGDFFIAGVGNTYPGRYTGIEFTLPEDFSLQGDSVVYARLSGQELIAYSEFGRPIRCILGIPSNTQPLSLQTMDATSLGGVHLRYAATENYDPTEDRPVNIFADGNSFMQFDVLDMFVEAINAGRCADSKVRFLFVIDPHDEGSSAYAGETYIFCDLSTVGLEIQYFPAGVLDRRKAFYWHQMMGAV
jgi:hypothetical protein